MKAYLEELLRRQELLAEEIFGMAIAEDAPAEQAQEETPPPAENRLRSDAQGWEPDSRKLRPDRAGTADTRQGGNLAARTDKAPERRTAPAERQAGLICTAGEPTMRAISRFFERDARRF